MKLRTLIPTPWERLFAEKVRGVGKSLKIACPFIKARYAKLLLACLPENSGIELLVLTRLKAGDLIAGASDLDALHLFNTARPDISVHLRFLNQLHAKMFIFDQREAIVTSTNLTYSGFNTNAELGVSLTAIDQISECAEHFDFLWEQSKPVTKEAILAIGEQIRTQRLNYQREQFLGVLQTPEKQVEKRQAVVRAIEESSTPEISPSVTPVRDEVLAFQPQPLIEPQTKEPEKTDSNDSDKDRLLLEKLTNTFKDLFGHKLNQVDAFAIFAHSSWTLPTDVDRNAVETKRTSFETVGFFALDLVILKQILSASREKTVVGELDAKQKVVKASGWFASTCKRLGLDRPLMGKSLEKEISDPKVSQRVSKEIALRIFGWLGLQSGLEGIFAASDSYFDLTEEFPFDLMSDADYKGKLQEYTQSKNRTLPQYSVLARQGTEHTPVFNVEVKLLGGRRFVGLGSSIKEAEFDAAKKAIEALQHEIRAFDATKQTTAPVLMKAGDLTSAEIRRLQKFWQEKVSPDSSRLFDWRVATIINASTMRLRGFLEQRMRDRYSCLGSHVLAYFATEEIAKQWSKEGVDSVDRGEFLPRLCGKKQLENAFMQLGFQNYALLASGESEISPTFKQDAIQVVFAILLLEFGEHKARGFFKRFAEIANDSFSKQPSQIQNYKGKLQEQVQGVRRTDSPAIEYKVLKEIAGPNPECEVQLWIGGQKFEKGLGRGKRDAEQQAAQRTLDSKTFSDFLIIQTAEGAKT